LVRTGIVVNNAHTLGFLKRKDAIICSTHKSEGLIWESEAVSRGFEGYFTEEAFFREPEGYLEGILQRRLGFFIYMF